METCLLNYFILNDELKGSCDFNPGILDKGPGIYEVFRVINSKPLFINEHIERFFQSAALEQFSINFSVRELKQKLRTLIEANGLKKGNIRFQYLIHPHIGPVFIAWIATTIYPTKSDFEKGVEIVSLSASRKKPNSKRTNLPVRQMAEEIIEKSGVAEVLLINEDELVTEGHRTNIFFVADEILYTSPVKLVLPGITRDKIIRLAKENGISVVEENIHISKLQSFEASFLSSTSKNVLQVKRIDNFHYQLGNKIVIELSKLFDKLIVDSLEAFSWD